MMIRTRIAPSPTGNFHIGTARTSLFNYLYTKSKNGKFILRIEDTDKERSKKEYEKEIFDSIEWLGIKVDEVYRQSERKLIYRKFIEKLINDKKAYISKEKEKNGDSMVEIIRFKNKNPNHISFYDEIRGVIKTDISDLGDFVIAKNIDEPLYNLAVVIDDHLMNITHILRGDDHIANTSRQIALFEAFDFNIPKFIHIPLIHTIDGGKMSKRKDAVSLEYYKNEGILKESMVNFLAFLGWNPKNEKELFNINQLIHSFGLEGIQKQNAVFNYKKLLWYNKHYMKKISNIKKINFVKNNLPVKYSIGNISFIKKILNKLFAKRYIEEFLIKELYEKNSTLSDLKKELNNNSYSFFFKEEEINTELIFADIGKDVVCMHLKNIKKILNNIYYWDLKNIKKIILKYCDMHSKKEVLWPLRSLLSGKEKSTDPFTIIVALGKEDSILRINNFINKIC